MNNQVKYFELLESDLSNAKTMERAQIWTKWYNWSFTGMSFFDYVFFKIIIIN